tara:strand:- start:50 stop:292 length:243 start_codon:yes stop_codon:yes gene_type:complete
MIVFDIGNTESVIGLYFNSKLKKIDKIRSFKSSNFFENIFKPQIIISGGLADIYKNKIQPKSIVKQNLTLEDLRIIGGKT